jgi:hypothetical protein
MTAPDARRVVFGRLDCREEPSSTAEAGLLHVETDWPQVPHGLLLALLLMAAVVPATSQNGPTAPSAATTDVPLANPGRPTVATPATLTPVGYLQFETGYLGAWNSPGVESQASVNEVVKFSVAPRLEFLVGYEPFAHSRLRSQSSNDKGGVALGLQGVVHRGEGLNPTIALSYFRSVYGGETPDLDIGSARNSGLILASVDAKGFHSDFNLFFNEQIDGATHRAQFGQTLSVSHGLVGKFGLAGELWHFTQPFLRSNTVGNLWAVNYNARNNLVFDGGFNRGLTGTATRWEVFVGFTYLLPRKVRWH